MHSKADTVDQYLDSLPADRRAAIETVRQVFLDNLDDQYEEGMSYGMIGYAVPHSVYPAGYHCNPKQPLPFGGLASQKGHMSLYLMCLYGDPTLEAWFRAEWAKTGKKLDMGKACIRFKKVEDLALDVLAESIRRVPARTYIERYESLLGRSGAQTDGTSSAGSRSSGKAKRGTSSARSRASGSARAKTSASSARSAKGKSKSAAAGTKTSKRAPKSGSTKSRKKTSTTGSRSSAARSTSRAAARSSSRRRARA